MLSGGRAHGRTGYWRYFVVFAALAVPLYGGAEGGAGSGGEASIMARSLVSMGDTARLQHVLAKARRGERVVVAVIGGSITAGAKASKPSLNYGSLVAEWWRTTFPQAEIEFVNAGIGATGSAIGAHRVRAHLLSHNPDFAVVEYAVNDKATPDVAQTLEGLVRQILKLPNHPAVMLLFTMHQDGSNAQEFHETVGRHYGLPMVSFRDALWPEVEAGRIAWDDIEADEVHPNDRGHRYCADFVVNVLERALAELPDDAPLGEISPMPAPKISDTFEYAIFYSADSITPLKNEGWITEKEQHFGNLYGASWKAFTPGSVLEFEVAGTAIGVLFFRIKGDMGVAEVTVDDGPPMKMDGRFEADWGGYTPFAQPAKDLAPGKHRVRITLLDEKSEKSNGHEFRVHAILVAGTNAQNDRE